MTWKVDRCFSLLKLRAEGPLSRRGIWWHGSAAVAHVDGSDNISVHITCCVSQTDELVNDDLIVYPLAKYDFLTPTWSKPLRRLSLTVRDVLKRSLLPVQTRFDADSLRDLRVTTLRGFILDRVSNFIELISNSSFKLRTRLHTRWNCVWPNLAADLTGITRSFA